jgi:hypothetical protein
MRSEAGYHLATLEEGATYRTTYSLFVSSFFAKVQKSQKILLLCGKNVVFGEGSFYSVLVRPKAGGGGKRRWLATS